MKRNILCVVLLQIVLMQTITMAQSTFPEWAKGIVWYQIFPERFDNGDSNNDPLPEKVFINEKQIPEGWSVTPWTSNWFASSEWENKLGGHWAHRLTSRRYGGDLQGIINRLDYLKELGVDAIYLNPIFEAVSMHKYDGSTFHHIDINFGTDPEGDKKLIESEIPDDPSTWIWTSADKLFLQLINEVHKRNMFIIIDGVFNHVGTQFWAFKDVLTNGNNSKYRDWFLIKQFDDPNTTENEFDYKGWWGHKSLPEFNRTENDLYPDVKKYIFNATKRWMNPDGDDSTADGINGWRLDVARDVPLGFWRDWNKVVKLINPSAVIVGELWEISSDFISDDGVFDALMNYNFAFAVSDFFINKTKKISSSEFVKRLKEIDLSYPENNLHLLQNLMSSHDTDRLLSMIINPDRKYDSDADQRNPNYNPRKPNENDYKILKLITAFQMTYRGAPMIYYGDEIGMWGADDPHDRKPMVWDDYIYDDEVIDKSSGFRAGFGNYTIEQNKDLLDFYKNIISIRKASKALRLGKVEFVQSSNSDVVLFLRQFEDDKYLMAFNSGLSETKTFIPFMGRAVDIVANKAVEQINELIIPPLSFKIFKTSDNK